ncbi:hypothetical protein BFW01_g6015 [Lasiodiplodia theobromae]|nr:hypothetical protein BFW01_g6015 [Lasiodiplodia theobromae]
MAHSFDSNGHHALVVPAQNVKTVKTFLEEHQILDKSRKIIPYTPESIQDDPSALPLRFNSGKRFMIPFLSRAPSTTPTNGSGATTIEAHFGDLTSALESRLTPDALSNVFIVHISTPGSGQTPTTQPNNPLRAAFHSALSTLPAETLSALSLTTAQLVADLPGTYSIYPPLLLLPAHTFHRPSWTAFLSAHHHRPLDTDPTTFQHLLAHVAQHLSVTHIALNAPIALHNAGATDQNDNILRSPTALTPLYGSFGPRVPANTIPDSSDFAAAFWATARQNGVAQTWAPLHTMFSRGNVKEKARMLGLASVVEAVRVGEEGSGSGDGRGRKGRRPAGCTAVDLYAGIGYFAFSYRKAGVRAVLGWEINPWSVEGLRRGAGMNGWGVTVVGDGEGEGVEDGQEGWESDFVVFRESNVYAAERVERLRERLPPVRHVNGGLLPTSRGAWETAVRVLDPEVGGWVHLHENFGESEIEEKADEVVVEVRRIWGVVKAERCGGDGVVLGEDFAVEDVVKLEHVERVKTYAPGVLHCVLDIWISPTGNMART